MYISPIIDDELTVVVEKLGYIQILQGFVKKSDYSWKKLNICDKIVKFVVENLP